MRYFEELLAALKDPALILDREYRIVEVGRSVSEMGYRPDSLRESNLKSVIAPPFRRAAEAAVDTAFRLGKVTFTNVEVLNSLGEAIPVEMRVSPIEEKGHVRFLVLFYPAYRIGTHVLDKMNVPVWSLDRRGNVLFYNVAAQEILKRMRSPLLSDGQTVEIDGSEYVARVYEMVDGFRRVSLVTLTNVCVAYEPHVKRFAVAGVLSALAAHDIKNAIASLLILADSIEDESLRSKIHNGIRRIFRIHKRILNLAKGKKEIDEVRLSSVLDEVLEDLRHKIIRKNVKVVREFPVGFTLRTDENALYEILLNLISNAIDASMPGGKVKVSAGVFHNVSLGRMEKYVSVRDFGPGIPPDKVDKIFNLFFTSKKNGSGLGLFIVKVLSESIGARVTVRSEPNKGAEFVVLFPTDEIKGSEEVHEAGSTRSN